MGTTPSAKVTVKATTPSAKANASVKATTPKAKLSIKANTPKSRRLQAPTTKPIDLNSADYETKLAQGEKLEGADQTDPTAENKGAWIVAVSGLMLFVQFLF